MSGQEIVICVFALLLGGSMILSVVACGACLALFVAHDALQRQIEGAAGEIDEAIRLMKEGGSCGDVGYGGEGGGGGYEDDGFLSDCPPDCPGCQALGPSGPTGHDGKNGSSGPCDCFGPYCRRDDSYKLN